MDQSGNPPPYQALPSPPPQPLSSPPGPIVVRPRPMFGRDPVQVTCGNCNQLVSSTVVTEIGACTWIAALVILFLCFPFFWVPLVMDSCKDYRHICPSCNAVLGVYKQV